MPSLSCRTALMALLLCLGACAPQPETSLEITVLTTADIHGRVLPWDYYRDQQDEAHSLLKAASLIAVRRDTAEHVLLLDAGDFIQGNPFADFHATERAEDGLHPLLRVMDAMDYDAIVLGNHEFNFGLDYLDRQISLSSSPILAGNVYRHGTREHAYTPYVIRELGGVRVGIIGLTTPGSAVWDRRHVEGVLDFGDGAEAAARLVPEVRTAGADVIVMLLHSGLEARSSYTAGGVAEENFGQTLLDSVPGIDVLVLAHTHRVIEGEPRTGADGRPVAVVQAGRWASHVGEVTLRLVRREGRWEVSPGTARAIPVVDAPVAPALAALVDADHQAVRDWVNEVVAGTPDRWSARDARLVDTPIIDLIQHVQKQVGEAQLSGSAAFTTTLEFGPGPITRADLATLYPYENTLVVLEVTGEQLREYLEYAAAFYEGLRDGEPVVAGGRPGYNFDMLAGVDYLVDLARPVGERVVELSYDGEPVQAQQRFSLAVNSYRAQGSGGYTMLVDTPVLREIDRSVRTLIEEYLAERGEIRHADVRQRNWAHVHEPDSLIAP